MTSPQSMENDFLKSITDITEKNISNERFGVSELARATGMSRSNLLRKVKKLTKLSVSQFIRQVRLKHAMDMLKQTSLTVSEISYKVGFGSTSYFVKCFHDYWGYPPGEVGNRNLEGNNKEQTIDPGKKRNIIILISTLFVVLLFALLFKVVKPFASGRLIREKSIAVLPFKNDSNDSSNVYIVNGLMESILNNLQKIEDLRVVSRTSVEKYRNTVLIIPEIARELNVNYFVEGSGQKIGDQILLNIQLIDAKTDRHLWSEQYSRKADEIFKLQMEVAKDIANKIEAIITPEEEERINQVPTDDLIAYDYFLKGLDQFYQGTREGLEEAIVNFTIAIEHDNGFARAYADIAISYYYLGLNQVDREHLEEIGYFADKAISLDPRLPQGLVAKALYFIKSGEYAMAASYLEKALLYNPNSPMVINLLSDFYANYVPDTGKYLEYALKGIRLDIASNDSATASLIYLHLSNALIQTGFVKEAESNINRSLEYDPGNLYSEYVKAYILFSTNRDLLKLKESLIKTLEKDTTRIDIIQEIGKTFYYLGDYEGSYYYYRKLIDFRKANDLNIYRFENAKIGYVLYQNGLIEESNQLFDDYLDYAENDKSIYKNLNLAAYYSFKENEEKALASLRLFSREDNYHYWTIIFLGIDPLFENIMEFPEFKEILHDIEIKFWNNHDQIRNSLQGKGLI